MAPQPEKFRRTLKANGFGGPPIPADIKTHNKMAREMTAVDDSNKYDRKPMAVSLAPVGKKLWNE